jgi:hypothetical protein
MGSVRSWDFDAVIGVGGIGSEARTEGIGGMVNWIGVGSRKERLSVGRGPLSRSITLFCSKRKVKSFGPSRLLSRGACIQRTLPDFCLTTTSTKRSKRR